jgi:zinc protease
MRTVFIAIFYFFLLPLGVSAQEELMMSDSFPLSANIRHGILKNGLTYYIVRHENPTKSIEMTLVEMAGALHIDTPDEIGVAHLIEHLGFRRTVHFPNGLKEFFESRGLTVGKHLNASTTSTTNYDLTIPSADSVILNYGLLALYDWAQGRLYIKQDVEEERSAVVQELSRAMTPAFQSLLQSKYLLLDKHPLYMPHISIESENIRHVSLETMVKFDREWYRPNQQAVIIVGDIDDVAVERKVRRLFSTLVNRSGASRIVDIRQTYDVHLTGKDKMVVVGRGPESSGVQIKLIKKRKSGVSIGGSTTKFDFKVRVMDDLYNLMTKNRLDKMAIRNKMKLGTVVHRIDRRTIDGLAGIDAMITYLEVDNLTQAKATIKYAMNELRRIELWGFTEDEFCRAKQMQAGKIRRRIDMVTSRSLVSALIGHFENRSAVLDNELEIYSDLMDQISVNEINEGAQKWLKETGNTDILFSVRDQNDTNIPRATSVFSWLSEFRSLNVEPYEEVLVKPFPKISIGPDKDSFSMSELNEIGAARIVLGNGVKVLLKRLGPPDENREPWDQVVMQGISPGGLVSYHDHDWASAAAAANLVNTSGIASVEQVKLQEWLNERNLDGYLAVGPYISDSEEGVSGACSLNNAEDMFNLVYLYFVKPRKDRRTFNHMFKRGHNEGRSVRASYQVFEDSVQATVNGVHGRLANELVHPRFKRAFNIYKQRFSNAGDFTFVIAGYFETAEMVENIVKYLGALPNRGPKEGVFRDRHPDFLNRGDLRVSMVGDSAGNVVVRLLFPGDGLTDEGDHLKLDVVKEAIQFRLLRRLRERDKVVFTVSSSLRGVRELGTYSLDISFETSPSDVDRAIEAVVDEIRQISEKGIEESILNNSTAIIKDIIVDELSSPFFWTNYIVSALRKNELPRDVSWRRETLDEFTESDFLVVLKKYVNLDHYSVFKAL